MGRNSLRRTTLAPIAAGIRQCSGRFQNLGDNFGGGKKLRGTSKQATRGEKRKSCVRGRTRVAVKGGQVAFVVALGAGDRVRFVLDGLIKNIEFSWENLCKSPLTIVDRGAV